MKNILVTGGAGYIGCHIVEQLVKKKSNIVYVLDNLSTGNKKYLYINIFFIVDLLLNSEVPFFTFFK